MVKPPGMQQNKVVIESFDEYDQISDAGFQAKQHTVNNSMISHNKSKSYIVPVPL